MKKVLLITEYLNPPYDEGIKKTVYNLFLDLDRNYEVQVICRFGFEKNNIHVVSTNPLFFSKEIRGIIKYFDPDSLVYLPFQSSTFASYLRLKVLSGFARNKNIIFIALQPKLLKKWQETIVKFLKPKFALTPSPTLNKFWDQIDIDSKLVPLFTDLSIFKPIDNLNNKQHLRKKYNLPLDAFIISHMGHLNEGRNLETLIPLQQNDVQVVIISSSSTPSDAHDSLTLKDELIEAGIIIIDQYIRNIEEIYQLSDLYIFPVIKKNSSIGMPLSVLEARACGITVLTSNYGSLNYFLDTDNGGIFYSDPENFSEKFQTIRKELNINLKKTKVAQLNNLFIDYIHKQINKNGFYNKKI